MKLAKVAVGIPGLGGAYASGDHTAIVVASVASGSVLVLTILGEAINWYPDWAERWEQAREAISRGRHRRKRRGQTKRIPRD